MKKNFFQSRKFKYGSAATVFTIAFVAFIVIFNIVFTALADKYLWRTDMTADKVFTLSDEARDIMSDIKNEVNIYFAAEAGDLMRMTTGYDNVYPRYVYTTALQLEKEFENVNVECVDVVKNPSFFREFYTTTATTITNTSVVVESNGEVRVFALNSFFTYNDTSNLDTCWAYSGEKKLISGIMQVTQTDTPKVVFTTEHGEDLVAATPLANLFVDNGFTIEIADLTKDTLDSDCRILVIYNPMYDFLGMEAEEESGNEIAKIDKFLDEYGCLLVFCDAEYTENLTNLNEYLEEWGISYTADTYIQDADHSMTIDNYSIIAEYQQSSTLGGSLYKDLNSLLTPPKAIIRNSAPIDILWESGGGLSGSRMVSPVLKSYSTSQLVENGTPTETGSYNMVTLSQESVIENNEYFYSYVFAFGSPTFANQNYIESNAYANEDILSAAMLATGRERVLAALTLKPFDDNKITITKKEANNWMFAMTLALPVVLAGCGAFVVIRRKHS
ncbi:MAG: hypothetical protein E7638_01060 [Ruminococcaceae bacterium]|nr:hypothetical protein [Oscillospiraceae bacterium]